MATTGVKSFWMSGLAAALAIAAALALVPGEAARAEEGVAVTTRKVSYYADGVGDTDNFVIVTLQPGQALLIKDVVSNVFDSQLPPPASETYYSLTIAENGHAVTALPELKSTDGSSKGRFETHFTSPLMIDEPGPVTLKIGNLPAGRVASVTVTGTLVTQ